MPRPGMSLPLNYVIIGLIGLVTTFSVIFYFTGNMDTVQNNIIDPLFASNEKELAKNTCVREKKSLCSGEYEDGSRQWARAAEYNKRSCWTWAEQDLIFGQEGIDDIPPC